MLATGQLKPTVMVLRQGTMKWRPLAEVAANATFGNRLKLAVLAAGGMLLLAVICWPFITLLAHLNHVDKPGGPDSAAGARASGGNGKNGSKESQGGGEEITPAPPQGPAERPIAREPRRDLVSLNNPSEVQPRLMVQLAHTDGTNCVDFFRDGKRVLTGSLDNTALVWDVGTGKVLLRFVGHRASVTSAVCSLDGNYVLTGSQDGTARLWSATSGKEVRRFEGMNVAVNCVDFAPGGNRVITGTGNYVQAFLMGVKANTCVVQLWDMSNGNELIRFQGHGGPILSARFSPNGTLIATGSADQTARLWDATKGTELLRFQHSDSVHSVAFSPDGKRLFTGFGKVLDGTARLWDIATGREMLCLRGPANATASAELQAQQAAINSYTPAVQEKLKSAIQNIIHDRQQRQKIVDALAGAGAGHVRRRGSGREANGT